MCCLGYCKKSLKIPKGGLEPVNRQITDWPNEKGLTDVRHKTTGRATVHLNNNRGELRCSGRVNSSCSVNKGNNKITELRQSYKGKVKTHNYINRQNQ